LRHIFERDALYQEVWQTPLTTLAKKYGLSDNGLRKICKALTVPLPQAGHWAKVAAGQTVRTQPLPETNGRTTFESNPPLARSQGIPEDAEWFDERIAFEEKPENACVVELNPTQWHRALVPLRNALRDRHKKVETSRRAHEQRAKRPRAHEPSFDGADWRIFIHGDQILAPYGAMSSAVRAGLATYERALAILNAVCFAAERRNFSVEHDDKRGRLVLTHGTASIDVRISEKLKEDWRKETRWGDKLENVRYRIPTGILRFYVGRSYSEREICETPSAPLQARLNELFRVAYRQVIREREAQREHARWRKELEEAEKRRAIAEEQRRREAAALEAERKRRAALLQEAKDWQTSRLLRAYVRHITRSAKASQRTIDVTWTEWALRVADELDPTSAARG
jgi:hypothetical protein